MRTHLVDCVFKPIICIKCGMIPVNLCLHLHLYVSTSCRQCAHTHTPQIMCTHTHRTPQQMALPFCDVVSKQPCQSRCCPYPHGVDTLDHAVGFAGRSTGRVGECVGGRWAGVGSMDGGTDAQPVIFLMCVVPLCFPEALCTSRHRIPPRLLRLLRQTWCERIDYLSVTG